MNFYKHHIGDYDADTAHLTWIEDAAYRRLISLYCRREEPIPADLPQACRLVRATSKVERDAVVSVLREFFTLTDEGWRNKRCDAEIGGAKAKADANRNNGQRGGRPKKSETEDEPTDNPSETQSVSAQKVTGLRHAGGTNSQTPDSRLQKRDSDPGGSAAEAASPPGPKPMSVKDRIWLLGVPLVGEKGRSALGKLVAEHGADLVAEVLEQATVDPPVGDAKAWVIASCAARAKAQPGQRRFEGPQPGSAQALIDREPHPSWATNAGFPNVWEAENVGCYQHTAHLFREGRKVQ